MKSRLNNMISKYEVERDKLKSSGAPTVITTQRLEIVNEVIRALNQVKD